MTAPRTYRVLELFSGVGSQRMAFNIVSAQTGIEFEYVAQHVSNSQLYKQAGNSIVVDVLVHLYLSFLSPSKVGQSTIDSW